ncbi:acyl-CoA dehydrogenase [Levilactobacillus namurensis DSM 19117]|uniref:Acyl-CoA dehydrogenase n=1 Tax=Levilactobacillus namurensis DSM 19117 TaxID=1423773 RepID=A0A0R1JPC7_9LACO|nr:acyl-CoA dehydrogenase family protein [Levilactobacillus namurensis]KRK73016.1 acyl-CoA dehydrogenase [Levilactobacillus namurensis DSM 19117]GEO73740.1 acyl-CoA dehydrogenase [Levilactobacillus namurensis]
MSTRNTAAEKLLLQMVDDYTAREVAPLDMAIDHAQDYPEGFMKKLTETGFLGLMLPQEFGGAEFGPEVTATVLNHLARGNASTAVTLEGHFKTIDQILKFGTPALKQALLPSANQRIFAFSMTEASGGSNPMGISSTATREGDHWVINGDKIMITNGGLAQVYCVLVKTAPDQLSVFVVDQDMPGFSFGKREDFIGLRGTPVGEIMMDHIIVDDDHLLGHLGDGGLIGDSAHDDARILMGAVLTGIMEHELKIATDYAKERKAGDKPLTELQVTHRKVADIAMRKETTKLLYQRAAQLKAAGQPYSEEAAMAKAHGSRAAVAAGDDALQILAGYGYSREYPVEHLIRDARAMEIAEGTVEKMRSAIATAEFQK